MSKGVCWLFRHDKIREFEQCQQYSTSLLHLSALLLFLLTSFTGRIFLTIGKYGHQKHQALCWGHSKE